MNDLIFKVLDHGFVQVVDKMGTDKTVVNSARLSYSNHSFAEQDMTDKDLRLLGYLAEHKHLSPFRHCYVSFLIRAPEFVMRQWYKHAVGASWFAEGNPDTPWNEASQRFKEVEPVFYEPYEWLAQNTENKQASGKPLHHETQQVCHMVAGHAQRFAWEKYQELLLHGVSREQARMVLPLNIYTTAQWTASLQAIANFVKLRIASDAQTEIQLYASAISEGMFELFPHSWGVLMGV